MEILEVSASAIAKTESVDATSQQKQRQAMTKDEAFADDAIDSPLNTDTPDKHEGETLWCLHCERAYPYGWYRPVKQGRQTLHYCPYDGCDGDIFMDAWPWSKVRGANPQYPEEPELGKRYPLYAGS